jgi:hypothetical protein
MTKKCFIIVKQTLHNYGQSMGQLSVCICSVWFIIIDMNPTHLWTVSVSTETSETYGSIWVHFTYIHYNYAVSPLVPFWNNMQFALKILEKLFCHLDTNPNTIYKYHQPNRPNHSLFHSIGFHLLCKIVYIKYQILSVKNVSLKRFKRLKRHCF